MKTKTGAFKHREYNSQALVMISTILKRKGGKKISFTCFSVKEKEQLYYPKSPLELLVLLGAHFLSMQTDLPSVTTHWAVAWTLCAIWMVLLHHLSTRTGHVSVAQSLSTYRAGYLF